MMTFEQWFLVNHEKIIDDNIELNGDLTKCLWHNMFKEIWTAGHSQGFEVGIAYQKLANLSAGLENNNLV